VEKEESLMREREGKLCIPELTEKSGLAVAFDFTTVFASSPPTYSNFLSPTLTSLCS
jgi:hypothetical protein